ncbi:MAG: DegT/DnrJ/EryC1/StrS aminotransferase family protein [Treponema sp.]|nr:DegT/DnrJ/EryC1/StrS aminotransferase family protein [Treponema sp.]
MKPPRGHTDPAGEPIPFSRPYIGTEEEDAVLAVLRSGWLTTGKETLAFEEEFASFLRDRDGGGGPLYCMAVNSATSGLHLALEACGVTQGDIVLVPSMTFTATAEVARYLGAEAVFVDVAVGGYNIDPAALERTLERLKKGLPAYPPRSGGGEGFGPRGRAAAVLPVHYGGLPCDMDAILDIAGRYRLSVIEDAAHSFPSFVPDGSESGTGRWAGAMGDAGVFSFYATKTITTGEGGMVVTRDKAIASRVRLMRCHGIDRSVWNRYSDTSASWYYEVLAPGFKYNIPDILSALGRAQLRRATQLLSMRRELARRYDEAFAGDSSFIIPPTGPGDARHLYPLRLNREKLSITRDEFAAKTQERGIGISVHFIPLHTMPYYKERYALEDGDFPETLNTYRQSVSLPLWPGMSEAQTDRVIAVVKDVCSGYSGRQENR